MKYVAANRIKTTPNIPPVNITANCPALSPIKSGPTCGNVTAIAIAASIESIAKAISANSTFSTVIQKLLPFVSLPSSLAIFGTDGSSV